jgi:hypothetical protein
MCVCVYVYVGLCVCMWVCVCVCARTCVRACTYVCVPYRPLTNARIEENQLINPIASLCEGHTI